MSDLDLYESISNWDTTYGGSRLRITVRVQPLNMYKTFLRLNHERPSKWKWMTAKNDMPDKEVSEDARSVLDNLVLCHPVLNKFASEFGITSDKEWPDNHPYPDLAYATQQLIELLPVHSVLEAKYIELREAVQDAVSVARQIEGSPHWRILGVEFRHMRDVLAK